MRKPIAQVTICPRFGAMTPEAAVVVCFVLGFVCVRSSFQFVFQLFGCFVVVVVLLLLVVVMCVCVLLLLLLFLGAVVLF